jgi:hypothetical protein
LKKCCKNDYNEDGDCHKHVSYSITRGKYAAIERMLEICQKDDEMAVAADGIFDLILKVVVAPDSEGRIIDADGAEIVVTYKPPKWWEKASGEEAS